MAARIMVTGVPGVGKSSVVSHPRIPAFGLSVRNFGAVMYNIAKAASILSSPPELEAIDLNVRVGLQAKAAEEIDREANSVPVLIDGHLLVDTSRGFVPGLPIECVQKLKLDAIVVLSATADEVLQRRRTNSSKYAMFRNDVERVDLHQKALLEASLYYAVLSQASFEVLRNPDGKLDQCVDDFQRVLRSIVPDLPEF
jgi:adenylate kinase